MSFARILPLGLLLMAVVGCKVARPTIVAGPPGRSPEEVIRSVSEAKGFKTLSARLHVNYSNKKGEQSFGARLRLIEDSVLWVSITPALGIEVARILVTPDSIKVVDRIGKRYLLGDRGMMDSVLQVPFTFSILQQLILGRFIRFEHTPEYGITADTALYRVTTTNPGHLPGGHAVDHGSELGLSQLEVCSTHLRDRSSGYELSATYLEHIHTATGLFPQKMRFEIVGNDRIHVQMEWSKTEFGEIFEVPFSIPASYEPIR